MNNTFKVTAQGDTLLLGSSFHTLNDETVDVFETDNMDAFAAFMKGRENVNLFYNEKSVHAMPFKVNRFGDPVAKLNLYPTNALERLRSRIGSKMTLNNFEEFLFEMREYLGENSLMLLSKVKHLMVTKVVKMEREKLQNGDFTFAISSKAEKGSFTPPEILEFEVPIFRHLDHSRIFSVSLFFDFQQTDEAVVMTFTMKSPTFSEELEQSQKEIVEEELLGLDFHKFWGSLQVNRRDDSWKYIKNGIDHVSR